MNFREVAIIGCGPAGLLAAHAAVLADYSPVIYSIKAEASPNARATYLHRAIPDITSSEPDGPVYFHKLGSQEVYAWKVYGKLDAPTSWEKFQNGAVPAWALAPAYDALWRLYRGAIRECEINHEEAVALAWNYRTVINTAPLPALCDGTHKFPSRPIWVRDGAAAGILEGQMVYNGSPLDAWYRSSSLFGVESTEFAHRTLNAREGIKVLPTDCDCHPSIVRAGRWGTWMPGVLLHHAFEEAVDALQ